MKKRAIWMMVPAVALGFAACKKKDEPKAPETPAAVATPVPAPPPAPPVQTTTALSPEERAAKLGFVKHLPQDTEVVMALHNGSKSADRIQSTKLWKLIQSQMGMGMMGGGGDFADPDEEMDEDFALPDAEQDAVEEAEPNEEGEAEVELAGPSMLFGTEFTIAMGKTTGVQTANLLTLNRRSTYFQMRALAKAFAAAAKTGDFSDMEDGLNETFGPEMFQNLLSDPESGMALFEAMNMPPIYLAFKTSSANQPAAVQQLAALTENLVMMGEMVEPVSIEAAGQTFSGQKISGEKISASLAEEREGMEEMLDPADVDRLLAAIAKKDIVVLSGTIGDYALLFIGSSVDDLKLVPDIGQSLVASDALAFCDAYAAKELAAVIYGQKNAMDQLIKSAGGLADIAGGLRDGLSGTDGLGDTRDLETLLRMVVDREKALLALSGNEDFGMTAFFEDGLKIESYGGNDSGMVDWTSPNRLASLGDSPDVVMFANMTTEAAYDEKARAYMEALMETAYSMAMKVAEFPGDDDDMAQFKEMAKLFDTKFRSDLVAMWKSFSGGFGESLGDESAWIVDLNGSVPAIPGIPQPVVDDGKFPRISMIAPVTNREKLAGSWGEMNTSLTSILANVSEMVGEEIPMQKPISSERNGYTTWFFSMPFFNDDFMPSVTVGDEWFVASTSKNQALDLVGKASTGGETRTGMWFSMNFKALEAFSQKTIEVLGENADALGMSPSDLDDAQNLIKAMEDLDSLTVHTRRAGGVLRTSVHLKAR